MNMITLGIESTAHTLGVGISDNGKILANGKSMYKPKKEGILPRKAADHHAEVFQEILENALEKAGVSLAEIELFAFSQGPGIGACLRASCIGAKYLSSKYEKPIIGVNHCEAHLVISKGMLGMEDPLSLYVSGGNTQVIAERGEGYEVLGETLDIGVGNLFDTFGRSMGLEFAHGSVLSALAEKGGYIGMPYTVKGMNFAFSGLLTHAVKALEKERKEDIAYSLMETAFAELCEATERALCLTKKKEVQVCGGVAQNKHLQEMLKEMCAEHGARFGVTKGEYNADNGAMIAYTGELNYKKGERLALKDAKPRQKWRIDEV